MEEAQALHNSLQPSADFHLQNKAHLLLEHLQPARNLLQSIPDNASGKVVILEEFDVAWKSVLRAVTGWVH